MKDGIRLKLRLNIKVENRDGSKGIQIAVDKRYDGDERFFVVTLIDITEEQKNQIQLDPEGEELDESSLSQFLFYMGAYAGGYNISSEAQEFKHGDYNHHFAGLLTFFAHMGGKISFI
jgi:hypothetical protein